MGRVLGRLVQEVVKFYLIFIFARATQVVLHSPYILPCCVHLGTLRRARNEEPLIQAGKRLVMFTKEVV
jgi:hypothetical protein